MEIFRGALKLLKTALPTQNSGSSDLLALPAAATEKNDADGGDEGFGDDDGPEDAVGAHADGDRQEVGQGNFQQPEAEKIHDGGSDSVAGAVERLEHDHAVGV